MKIISQFKDYYDHVAHQYGGGDPKVVYHRTHIGKEDLKGKFFLGQGRVITVPGMCEFPIQTKRGYASSNLPYVRYLVVAGIAYAVLDFSSYSGEVILELYDPVKHKELVTDVGHRQHGRPASTPQSLRSIKLNVEEPLILEITRKIGHPVFTLRAHDYDRAYCRTSFLIDHECPKLSDVKFSSLFSPEQVYQNLSYFVGNLMRESPDLAPPVNVADKDRIVQHGFDLKQSFRHRK